MKRFQLRNQVRTRFGDDEGALASDFDINLWLDLAVASAWRYRRWPFTRQTAQLASIADGRLILPVGASSVKKVQDSTGRALLPKAERWLRDINPQGSLAEYYSEGGFYQTNSDQPMQRTVSLWPKPAEGTLFDIVYLSGPAEMTDDEHYPPLPSDFDEAIINWTLSKAYRRIDDIGAARAAEEAYLNEMVQLVELYGPFQQESFETVDVSDEDSWNLPGVIY